LPGCFLLISWLISLKPYTQVCYFPSFASHQHFFPPIFKKSVFFRKKTHDKRRTHTQERKTSGGQINHVATRVCHDAKTLF
jgi:hypothetical protein